jgi:imidazolonepropionase
LSVAEPSRDLVVRRARVVTCAGAGESAKDRLGTIDDGAIVIRGGRVAWVGTDAECAPVRGARTIDAGGRIVLPGLVDPHTHLVFAGSRIDEFARKMAGEDYRSIAAKGGGIQSTVRATRIASDDHLFASASARALAMRACGTTTIEVKSGYGLSVEHELRLLEVGRRVHAEGIARTTTTLLGAHAVPLEKQGDRKSYVGDVIGAMIPRAADLGVADACDVYLDEGAFLREEAAAILRAAKQVNLRVKAHVGQFRDLRGAELVAKLGGLSCDHLEQVSDDGLRAMAAAGTRAVLLPGAWTTLRQTPPDAARIRAHGVAMAIGTDCNPGTSPCTDLPLCAALAVRDAGVTLEEAILGITVEAARAIGVAGVGTIAAGSWGDLAAYEHDDPRALGYAIGGLRASWVALGGAMVVEPSQDRTPVGAIW